MRWREDKQRNGTNCLRYEGHPIADGGNYHFTKSFGGIKNVW